MPLRCSLAYAQPAPSAICLITECRPEHLCGLPADLNQSRAKSMVATIRTVLPGYFQTMGIPLIGGRDFTGADDVEVRPHRFIVSEAFVHKYLGERKSARSADQSSGWNVKNPFRPDYRRGRPMSRIRRSISPPLLRFTIHTLIWPTIAWFSSFGPPTDPCAQTEPIRRIVRSIDPAQPIADVRTMDTK